VELYAPRRTSPICSGTDSLPGPAREAQQPDPTPT
jgi:hypothetical protein